MFLSISIIDFGKKSVLFFFESHNHIILNLTPELTFSHKQIHCEIFKKSSQVEHIFFFDIDQKKPLKKTVRMLKMNPKTQEIEYSKNENDISSLIFHNIPNRSIWF